MFFAVLLLAANCVYASNSTVGIVVYPPHNKTGDPSLDWLAFALQDRLYADLAFVPDLNSKNVQDRMDTISKKCPGLRMACLNRLPNSYFESVSAATDDDFVLTGEYVQEGKEIIVRFEVHGLGGRDGGQLVFRATPDGLARAASLGILRLAKSMGWAVPPPNVSMIKSRPAMGIALWREYGKGLMFVMQFDSPQYQPVDEPLGDGVEPIKDDERRASLMPAYIELARRLERTDQRKQSAEISLLLAEAAWSWGKAGVLDPQRASAQALQKVNEALKVDSMLLRAIAARAVLLDDAKTALQAYLKAVEVAPGTYLKGLDKHLQAYVSDSMQQSEVVHGVMTKSLQQWVSRRHPAWSISMRQRISLALSVSYAGREKFVDAWSMLEPLLQNKEFRNALQPICSLAKYATLLAKGTGNFLEARAYADDVQRLIPLAEDRVALLTCARYVEDRDMKSYLGDESQQEMTRLLLKRAEELVPTTKDLVGKKALAFLLATLSGIDPKEAIRLSEKLAPLNHATTPESVRVRSWFLGEAELNAELARYLKALRAYPVFQQLSESERLDFLTAELLLALRSENLAVAEEVSAEKSFLAYVQEDKLRDYVGYQKNLFAKQFVAGRIASALETVDRIQFLFGRMRALSDDQRAMLEGLRWMTMRAAASAKTGEVSPEFVAQERRLCLAEVTAFNGLLSKEYIWYGKALAELQSAEAVCEKETVSGYANRLYEAVGDRWSAVKKINLTEDMMGANKVGLGIALSYTPGGELLVKRVIKGSPADHAGLRRGDVILEVGGHAASKLGDEEVLSEAMNDAAPELPVVFVRQRDGRAERISVLRAPYEAKAIQHVDVFNIDRRRVGYLRLAKFEDVSAAEIQKVLGTFKEAGADELILDLRDNQGGYVSLVQAIANGLLPAHYDTQLLYRIRNRVSTDEVLINPVGQTLGLSRLVVLTSRSTCSASELLINALRGHIEVVTIGEKTCGKPYGFRSTDLGRWRVLAVNFQLENVSGKGGYTDGIEPDCVVRDTFNKPVGDVSETLLAAGLSYITHGRCPG